MTNNSAKCILFVFTFLSAFAFARGTECSAQEPPIKIEIMANRTPVVIGKGSPYAHTKVIESRFIRVTSLAKRLVVQKCTFNKGACESSLTQQITLESRGPTEYHTLLPEFLGSYDRNRSGSMVL